MTISFAFNGLFPDQIKNFCSFLVHYWLTWLFKVTQGLGPKQATLLYPIPFSVENFKNSFVEIPAGRWLEDAASATCEAVLHLSGSNYRYSKSLGLG